MKDDQLKEWLRVDGDEDDATLESLETAARLFITNSTGFSSWDQPDDLAKTAVRMLVARWYENRESVGKGEELGMALNSILFQLRWTPGAGEVTTDASG